MNGSSELTEKDGAFLEQNCTIEIDGHSLPNGGGWLCKRVDTGKYEGLLYAYLSEHEIGSWNGSIKIPARFGYSWHSNMGDIRQSVYFTHEIDSVKHYFYGVYYKSGSDIVRVKEVKPWK